MMHEGFGSSRGSWAVRASTSIHFKCRGDAQGRGRLPEKPPSPPCPVLPCLRVSHRRGARTRGELLPAKAALKGAQPKGPRATQA
eukprot:6189916-Alexandrium_andersonii.AAC.1